MEIEFTARPGDNWAFDLAASVQSAELDRTIAFFSPTRATIPAGVELTHTPDYQLSGSITYRRPLNERFTLSPNLNFVASSGGIGRLGNPDSERGSGAQVNAGVALEWDNWSASLTVSNLFDDDTPHSVDPLNRFFVVPQPEPHNCSCEHDCKEARTQPPNPARGARHTSPAAPGVLHIRRISPA